jgi:hypothetical protein
VEQQGGFADPSPAAEHDELARPRVAARLNAAEEGELRVAVKKHTLLQI